MKLRLTPAVAAAVAAATVGGVMIATAGTALAAPGWEPDPNAAAPYGRVVLYDASGHVLTGGSNLSHIADYAAATTVGGATDGGTGAKATLVFATPTPSTPTGSWPNASASGSTGYPSTTAPAPLTGPGFANPLVHMASTDANLTNYVAGHPSSTTSGFQNIVQVRIIDTGPNGGSGSSYWESDISFDPTAGTWQMLDPAVTTTSTTLTTNPANGGSALQGSGVSLSADVSPAKDGTIQFFDGTTPVGSPHAITSASTHPMATDTDPAPANGTHNYTAVFTPTGGTFVKESTSNTSTVTIHPPQVATTTALAINPASTAQFTSADFTATITEADAGTAGEAGQVVFTAVGPAPSTSTNTLGTQSTGTTSGSSTVYTLHVASVSLPQGDYKVKASFTPTNTAYGASNSGDPASPNFTVTASACPGAPDPSGATCTTSGNLDVTVSPGSLTITTPYTASNVYHLPDMQLSPDATRLQSSARFPKTGDPDIIVHSSLAGDPTWTVSVSATDLTAGSKSIDGAGLGLTGGTLDSSPAFGRSVTFTDNPTHDPSKTDGNHGIKAGPWTFAQSVGGGDGSAGLFGTLTLYAPTSTTAGTYAGTITFSVA